MSAITSSSKLIAAILALLIVGGGLFAYQNFKDDNSTKTHWIPQRNGSGTFAPQAQFGERAMADQALGSYAESVGAGPSLFRGNLIAEAEPTMEESEVIALAGSHPKVAEYISNHPQYNNWTYFDGIRWYVSYYDYNIPEDWADVVILDQDATIIQVYVIQGDDVYLEWPTAQLDADRTLEIVSQDEIVKEYLESTNTSLLSAWVWFDGLGTWFVSYRVYYFFSDLTIPAEDARASIGEDLGFTQPAEETAAPVESERLVSPDFNPYWMEIHVSDADAGVNQILSNFEESSFLSHSMQETLEYAKSLEQYRTFAEQANYVYSWLSIRWDYDQGIPVAKWEFSAYSWDSRSIDGVEGFTSLEYYSTRQMSLVLGDDDYTLMEFDQTADPAKSPEEVLTVFLANQTVNEFIERYGEINGFVSYDPFNERWWISLFPSWTWGAYLWASLDQQGEIKDFWKNDIPDDQFPTKTVEEVRTLIHSLTEYVDFVETYEVYGNVNTRVYYSYQYEGTEMQWIGYAWSDVIGEAYLNIRIDDQTGEVLEISRTDPLVPPTHNTSEIMQLVAQLPEVQAFLSEVTDPVIWVSYYSNYNEMNVTGIWYVTYSSKDFTRQISIQIDDATLEVISIYQYPEN